MEKVVGNCGKHPGQSMINCPLCDIERGKHLINAIMRTGQKDLCVTTWGAVLRVEKFRSTKGIVTVSDPNAVDAGMDISINDIVLLARRKYI